MALDGQPGFWKSVVLDMVLHPKRESFGWREVVIIFALLAVAFLVFELPVILLRKAARRVWRKSGDEFRKANRLPPCDKESTDD